MSSSAMRRFAICARHKVSKTITARARSISGSKVKRSTDQDYYDDTIISLEFVRATVR